MKGCLLLIFRNLPDTGVIKIAPVIIPIKFTFKNEE